MVYKQYRFNPRGKVLGKALGRLLFVLAHSLLPLWLKFNPILAQGCICGVLLWEFRSTQRQTGLVYPQSLYEYGLVCVLKKCSFFLLILALGRQLAIKTVTARPCLRL